ncbi:unnamed protein product [Caenorhabditis angaria]|uniref:WD_REPEATS_REGION domain-containing protein n=1 Tax=Caenorhabditis angaria TaxID=860376 RepID=A0A9P1IV75_9PELO|nr:unnamed protein product [Caenorhabditis angaria]
MLLENSNNYAQLKSIVGRSAVCVNGIALHQQTDTLLQVAGSSVIVTSTSNQDHLEGHLISVAKQQFSCVSITSCGRFAATGENGHNPSVRLWQIRDDRGNFVGKLIRSMNAHSVGINIVRFTPDDSTLISIGCQHDAQIITWDWKNGLDLGVGKLMSPVNALTISYDSSMCVTVGAKSVKYWFLPMASDGVSKRAGLTSRSAILADKRNVNFVDATFCDSTNRLVAVTATGEIVEFNGNKKYVKCYNWKDSGDFKAVCISRIPEGLLIGCSDGLVRLFCLLGDDLDFLADLAPPMHILIDPSIVDSPQKLQDHPDDAIFPEPRCIVSSPFGPHFVVGYSDRSLVAFSRDHGNWGFKRASLGHVGSVNCIESFPSTSPCLPPGTVITGGSDGTIRFWNFEANENRAEVSNILCPSLLKVVYLDDNQELLTDRRILDTVGPAKEDEESVGGGVLCTKVSHDGRMMVAGTSNGMLYLIDLSFSDMPILDVINAHDNEICSLDFSDHASTSSNDQPAFLVSGGRDRFVHIFRKVPYSSEFVHCAVLDSHKAAIKSVKFAANNGKLHLYTCAVDRTMIIWRFDNFKENQNLCEFSRLQQIQTSSSISDMKFIRYCDLIVIGGHDRILKHYDLEGKHLRDVKSMDDSEIAGKIVKIAIDSSGSYVCTICSDKYIYLSDLRTGNCLAILCGFGAPPTDVVFSDDFRCVFVTTANGAIFIWRIAKNLTERMISAQVRLMEQVTMRTASPDSLLGSGSETISESTHSFSKPLGAPEFSGSTTSLGSNDDFSATGSQMKNNTWHPIGGSSYARIGDSSFSPSVQSAPAVERRTHTNLFSPSDQYETDASETQSDFISAGSRRRNNRIFSEEDQHNNFLAAPIGEVRRSASPLSPFGGAAHLQQDDSLRGYQSSKSMMNLRDVSGRVPTAKELMLSHIRNSNGGGSSSNLGSTTPTSRMRWGEMAPVQQNPSNDWQPSSTSDIHHISPVMVSPMNRSVYQNGPPPVTPRTTSRLLTTPPSHQALQQIQANSPFRRKSMDRNSLSRKFLDNGGTQPKTVWSPQNITTTAAPRKSFTDLFAATNSEATVPSPITRRLEEPSFSSSLRSRSQSPNKLALSQMLGSRNEVSSSASSTVSGMTKTKRRDSDMSYVRSATRGRDELRKSTDALNKLMAVRSKLHQSSENLRKSTENLSIVDGSRTRSITNLRAPSRNMETFGTFDADSKSQYGSTSSLAHSRMLARSMTNMNENIAMEGSAANRDYDSPSKRLANTIQMMRKASNPDLTAPEQYTNQEETSPFAMKPRGAVQKKMDRYRLKNKSIGGGRNQTSEESDNSDIPCGKRNVIGGTTSSDYSPASSTRSSSLANTQMSVSSARRFYDQQGSRPAPPATPRRVGGNYLVTKMTEQLNNKSMEGPDLGSDDSPRSSVNSHDWQSLIETGRDGNKHPLICHVQDCMEQLRIHVDKLSQAKRMVEEDSSLPIEQKKIVTCEIDRSIERVVEKLAPKEVTLANDYAPSKNSNIYGILKENLTSRQ